MNVNQYKKCPHVEQILYYSHKTENKKKMLNNPCVPFKRCKNSCEYPTSQS